MLAEDFLDQGILLHFLQGLMERARQGLDTVGFPLVFCHGKDVRGLLSGNFHLLLDAVEAGCQAEGELEVGVGRRVRAAELDTGRSASRCGNPDQGRTV